jgi:hypothetical protein
MGTPAKKSEAESQKSKVEERGMNRGKVAAFDFQLSAVNVLV